MSLQQALNFIQSEQKKVFDSLDNIITRLEKSEEKK